MSKTDTITLPSRQLLPDGTPNPDYDATLDPGSGRCDYERYFSLRPQGRYRILRDRENPQDTTVQASINGHRQEWQVETDPVMAEDFGELLVARSVAYRIG